MKKILLFLSAVLLASCSFVGTPSSGSKGIDKLEISVLQTGAQEQIIEHLGYVVSFNFQTRLPNWVAYELTDVETQGAVPRKNHFYPDPKVRGAQADNDDYRRSGWDRGHMAPAADMKWNTTAMEESFYFSNICPQNHNLNGGDWKAIEELSRDMAVKYGKVYIVCGPIIGEAKNGTIGYNRVVVPDAFYKVLLAPTKNSYEGIGFICENKAGHKNIMQYACSIDDVEALVGIDFFPALPDEIEDAVEADYWVGAWNLIR